MKFLTISDTHNKHRMIPSSWLQPADAIIHAGDISGRGYLMEIDAFLAWFSSLDQYKYKIFIAGNHDFSLEKTNRNFEQVMELLKQYPNIIYLKDDFVIIEGIKIYGSPWQPEFYDWAFNLPRGQALADKWKLIPEDTDILITHGPAYGHSDLVIHDNERVGCKDLLKRIDEIKPKYHICGHIHCGYGQSENEHTKFINASTLDEGYMVMNEPIIFELTK